MTEHTATRLQSGDEALARELFVAMSKVFGQEARPLRDGYLKKLLVRHDFWAIAVFWENEIVGGLTAHTLPMTHTEMEEIFIYDVAVRSDHQRRGVGRMLIELTRGLAAEDGISTLFVLAENEDDHAIEFYKVVGGTPVALTMFTFE